MFPDVWGEQFQHYSHFSGNRHCSLLTCPMLLLPAAHLVQELAAIFLQLWPTKLFSSLSLLILHLITLARRSLKSYWSSLRSPWWTAGIRSHLFQPLAAPGRQKGLWRALAIPLNQGQRTLHKLILEVSCGSLGYCKAIMTMPAWRCPQRQLAFPTLCRQVPGQIV